MNPLLEDEVHTPHRYLIVNKPGIVTGLFKKPRYALFRNSKSAHHCRHLSRCPDLYSRSHQFNPHVSSGERDDRAGLVVQLRICE